LAFGSNWVLGQSLINTAKNVSFIENMATSSLRNRLIPTIDLLSTKFKDLERELDNSKYLESSPTVTNKTEDYSSPSLISE
jgi:hypothetical protein